MIGPDYVTLRHCNHCVFYIIKYGTQCWCEHPDLKESQYIQEFYHTYVETRGWCPVLQKSKNRVVVASVNDDTDEITIHSINKVGDTK